MREDAGSGKKGGGLDDHSIGRRETRLIISIARTVRLNVPRRKVNNFVHFDTTFTTYNDAIERFHERDLVSLESFENRV